MPEARARSERVRVRLRLRLLGLTKYRTDKKPRMMESYREIIISNY